jgi:pantothenate synthetase
VQSSFDRVDYVALVDPETLVAPANSSSRLLVVVAAHLGTTRLIDNLVLGEESRP